MTGQLEVQPSAGAAALIRRISDGQLAELMTEPGQVAPVTRAIRRTGAETLRRHDTMNVSAISNAFTLPAHAGRAVEIVEAFPSFEELDAEHRFASLAATLPSPYDATAAIVGYLAKALPVGGGITIERIGAVIETLMDADDAATSYGRTLEGFSVPVVQVAVRSIFEEQKFFPTPAEMLQAAKEARRFFWSLQFAAARQRDLLANATRFLNARSAGLDDEIPF